MSILLRRRSSIRISLVRAVSVAVALALSATVATAGPPTLVDLADGLDAPTVGPRVTLDGGVPLAFGEIVPAADTPIYRLTVAGTPCGLWIDGPARLVYRVDDRFSLPLAERNLGQASNMTLRALGEGKGLDESLRGAVLWGWRLPATEEVSGAGASPVFPDWVKPHFDRPLFTRPSVEMLGSLRLGVGELLYGLLDGEREVLRVLRDPARTMNESIERVRPFESTSPLFNGRSATQTLIVQPLDRQWWDRFPAPLVAEATHLDVDAPSGETVTVRASSTLRATMDGVAVWRANLRSEATFRGKRRPLAVQSVKVDHTAVEYLHRDDQLLVALPRLNAGETVTVETEVRGDLAFRPAGDNFWSLGTWSWYPQPDLNGELARFDLKLRVPNAYVPFASGDVVEREEDEAFAKVTTRLEDPMQFPVLAAGNYTVHSETKDDITVHVATYAGDKKAAAERLMNNFFAAAEFYDHIFDEPYPFDEFTIIERNTWGFGQAPPGVIFITKEAFDTLLDETSRQFSRGINERYVHEVAHAWWGHVVKMDSLEEQWITESFASYASALCLEAMLGGKKGKRKFESLLRDWRGQAVDISEGGSIYLANHLAFGNADDASDRRRLLYNKGPVVLHALREELWERHGERDGDRHFFGMLRSFLKTFKHQWGPTRHLIGILEHQTGGEWQPWFERYVYGPEMPEIDL
ncbi:MAG: M1 family aminopeptidase [Acidobacteriota bacterium]